jgi:hypothetical protein
MNHADFVMEQLAMGLRSAYYPESGGGSSSQYGFQMVDEGGETDPKDVLRWVKIGTALVGADAPYAGDPHSVEVSLQTLDERGRGDESGLAVRSWRLDLQPEDFNPEDIEPIILSSHIVGLNCRMLDPQMEANAEELKWLDTWEGDNTNKLPRAVEITLMVESPRPNEDPIPIRRVVEIPLAELSWSARPSTTRGGSSRAPGGGGGRRSPTPSPGPRPGPNSNPDFNPGTMRRNPNSP